MRIVDTTSELSPYDRFSDGPGRTAARKLVSIAGVNPGAILDLSMSV